MTDGLASIPCRRGCIRDVPLGGQAGTGEFQIKASIADRLPATGGRDGGFFLGGAIAMVLVIVAGFSIQLAMGRSSFSAPPLVHAHAVVFMGWVVIFIFFEDLNNLYNTTTLRKRCCFVAILRHC